MFTPDPFEKKTNIPVQIVNGKVEFLYGGGLPPLKDGTVGNLVVPTFAVLSAETLDLIQQEPEVEILSEPATIWIAVRPSDDLPERSEKTKGLPTISGTSLHLVPVTFSRPLILKLHSTKKGELLDCPCSNERFVVKAKSLNHAYTLVSEIFEPHRRARGGNVFLHTYYQQGGLYRPLDHLRDIYQTRLEKHLNFAVELSNLLNLLPAAARPNQVMLFEPTEAEALADKFAPYSAAIGEAIGERLESLEEVVPKLKRSEIPDVVDALEALIPLCQPLQDLGYRCIAFARLVHATRECVFHRLPVEDEAFTELIDMLHGILLEISKPLCVEAEVMQEIRDYIITAIIKPTTRRRERPPRLEAHQIANAMGLAKVELVDRVLKDRSYLQNTDSRQ